MTKNQKKECEATHFSEAEADDDEMSCRQICSLRRCPGEFVFELSESSTTAATAPRAGHRAVAAPVAGSLTLVGCKLSFKTESKVCLAIYI